MRTYRSNETTSRWRQLLFRVNRALVRLLVRPTEVGDIPSDADTTVYVLANRSLIDLIVLDLVTAKHESPSPLLAHQPSGELKRFFFLNRSAGIGRKQSMVRYSDRFSRLLEWYSEQSDEKINLVPVSIFWGRTAGKDRSIIRSMLSDGWGVSSGLRRFLSLIFNRTDILVQFSEALPWDEAIYPAEPSNRSMRRTARILRVAFRNARVASVGPDLSHRRTLVERVVTSESVSKAIEESGESSSRLRRECRDIALRMTSDLSYPAMRVMRLLMRWFWNHTYEGLDVQELNRVFQYAQTHTLIFIPSHRAHGDYLAVSYLLYLNGLMIPYIAAGDNLRLPIVRYFLRGCGAFFIRRSFHDDLIYRTVLGEYLYRVLEQGNSIEFFVEGRRSRSGWMLPPRRGFMRMVVECLERGLRKPLCIVPVYISYEKVVEMKSHIAELKGATKQTESIPGLLRNVRLFGSNLGSAVVRIGNPIEIESDDGDRDRSEKVSELVTSVVHNINDSAVVNAVNLVAFATLPAPKQVVDEQILHSQIDVAREIVRAEADRHDYRVTDEPTAEIIDHVVRLGFISREEDRYGATYSHTPNATLELQWHCNNVLHTIAHTALVAQVIASSQYELSDNEVFGRVAKVLPYLDAVLSTTSDAETVQRCIDFLVQRGLLLRSEGAEQLIKPEDPQLNFQLTLLGNLVVPLLEQFYISLNLIANWSELDLTVESLIDRSTAIAQRVATILNAGPAEFITSDLIREFVSTLMKNGVVEAGSDQLVLADRNPQLLEVLQGLHRSEFVVAVSRFHSRDPVR